MSKFEKDVLLYLRNLAGKFYCLSDKLNILTEKVDKLEAIMMKGFQATGMAFHQTKVVVNKLAEATEETRNDLAEYGGVIETDSFFRGC
jgi:hypothetical protein